MLSTEKVSGRLLELKRTRKTTRVDMALVVVLTGYSVSVIQYGLQNPTTSRQENMLARIQLPTHRMVDLVCAVKYFKYFKLTDG